MVVRNREPAGTGRILLWDSNFSYTPPDPEMLDHIREVVGPCTEAQMPLHKMDVGRIQGVAGNDCAVFVLQALEALYVNRSRIHWETEADISIARYLSPDVQQQDMQQTRETLKQCFSTLQTDVLAAAKQGDDVGTVLARVLYSRPVHTLPLTGTPNHAVVGHTPRSTKKRRQQSLQECCCPRV